MASDWPGTAFSVGTGLPEEAPIGTGPPETAPVAIDAKGDLLLVATAGPRVRHDYRVSSRALVRASRFWEAVIWAGRPAGPLPRTPAPLLPPWTAHLDLADQRAHAGQLRTLLDAAHGRLDRVPPPTPEALCSILVLANRCAMVPVLREHIRGWLQAGPSGPLADGLGDSGSAGPRLPRPFTHLRICWEAGLQPAFAAALARVAWHAQVDADGGLSGVEPAAAEPGSRATAWPLARQEVLAVAGAGDAVRRHRLRLVDSALRWLRHRVGLLHGAGGGGQGTSCRGGSPAAPSAAPSASPPDCDAVYYGLLVQELARERIDAHGLPAAAAVRKSPHALCAVLARVQQIRGGPGSGSESSSGRFLAGHDPCSPLGPVPAQVWRLRDAAAELEPAQVRHFEGQCAKMGG